MFFKQEKMGPMDNFIYWLGDEQSGEAAVIDPAWDVPKIIRVLKQNNLKLSYILLTHGHHDHVNGLDELLAVYPVDVYISANEAESLTPKVPSLKTLNDGDILSLGKLSISCIQTPGHTPGGICYRVNDILITGDTLFVNGCGRCDFDNSDVNNMYDSLQRICKLPGHITIYPGHDIGGSSDTISRQLESNPYLTCKDRDSFIRKRMGKRG